MRNIINVNEVLVAAYRDIGEWCQLAERQRREMPDADYNPICPTEHALQKSRSIQSEIGDASAQCPRWHDKFPGTNAYYFMAEKPEDWDVARPVAVWQITSGSDAPYYEVRTKDGGVNVKEFPNAVWYGPIYVPRKEYP